MTDCVGRRIACCRLNGCFRVLALYGVAFNPDGDMIASASLRVDTEKPGIADPRCVRSCLRLECHEGQQGTVAPVYVTCELPAN